MTSTGALKIVEIACAFEPADPFREWVEDGTVELIARLRTALPSSSAEAAEPVRIAVVVRVPITPDPWEAAAADALTEAARGVAGTLTLEFRERVRVNTILTHDPDNSATRDAIDFLRSDRAAFVAGSTFDLRGT